ncbi:hypothetical protein ACFQU2_08670 [Siccirubricoccus deserti]
MIAVVLLLVLLGVAVFAAATGGQAVPVVEILALTGAFLVFFGAGVYIAAVLGLLGILIGLTFSDRPWWAFAGQTLWGPSSISCSSRCRCSCSWARSCCGQGCRTGCTGR